MNGVRNLIAETRQTTLWISFLGIIALMIGVMVANFWDYTQDDVFITFAYSRNLAEGHGLVFNVGERVQGTTTPLWAILMAGVYGLTTDLLHTANFLGGVGLFITIVIVADLLRPYVSVYGRMAVALLMASAPIFYISLGMETLLYCMILATAFWAWSRGKAGWAFLAAAALTWTRADGVVLAGTFGLVALGEFLLKQRRFNDLLRLAFIYFGAIAPWFIFAQLYFGSFLPNTYHAKAEMLKGTIFLDEAWRWRDYLYHNNGLHWLALLFVPLGAVVVMRKMAGLRPVALWAGIYLAGYTVLNTSFFWYYTPLFVAGLVLAVIGGEWTATLLAQWLGRPVMVWASLIVVLVSAGLGWQQARTFAEPPPRVETYTRLGKWIEANTPEDAVIAVGDLGIVGYYARRHTLDSFALITPEMYWQTPDYAAMKFKPDYVVGNTDTMFARFVHQHWFRYHYAPVVQMSTHGDGFSPMTLYRLRWPLEDAPTAVYEGDILPLSCAIRVPKGERMPQETWARLYTLDGEMVAEHGHFFLWFSYPGARAVGDEVLQEQSLLPLTNIPPARYEWRLACGEVESRGEVEILAGDSAPTYQPTPEAIWPDFVRLRGVRLLGDHRTWSGGSLALVLDWETLASRLETPYVVNLELIDSHRNVKAGGDAAPLIPTTAWDVGMNVGGVWQMDLPRDLAAGRYTLQVGWYDTVAGERVRLAEGSAFELPLEIVNQWPGGSGNP